MLKLISKSSLLNVKRKIRQPRIIQSRTTANYWIFSTITTIGSLQSLLLALLLLLSTTTSQSKLHNNNNAQRLLLLL